MDDLWNGNYYKSHSDLQQAGAFEILDTFSFKGNEHVLDIGCGPGTISKRIADAVPQGKVIGIDPSMSMLAQALTDYKDVANLKFFCQKAEDFQLDWQFDVVTSFHALHFVKDKQRVFEQIKASLNPNGKVLIQVGSRFHPYMTDILKRPRWKSMHTFEYRSFPFPLDEARALLKSLGFTLTRAVEKKEPYLFASKEALEKWLLGWLSYPSGLTGQPLTELAAEFAESFCQNENRRSDIPLSFSPLIIEACLAQ